jgi:hypothetical protein
MGVPDGSEPNYFEEEMPRLLTVVATPPDYATASFDWLLQATLDAD